MIHRHLIFALSLVTFSVKAQLYIGITGDFGNRASTSSDHHSALRFPISPSGSISFLKQEEIRDRWYLQYGASFGVLGFRIDAAEIDTLSIGPSYYDRYGNYNTLYFSGNFVFGKGVAVNNKIIRFFLGGGATTYFDAFGAETSTSTGIAMGNTSYTVFEYETHLADSKVKGFAEAAVQMDINKWGILGLRYRQHFSEALMGTYKFYHTESPLQGDLSVTQVALSFYFMVKIGRE